MVNVWNFAWIIQNQHLIRLLLLHWLEPLLLRRSMAWIGVNKKVSLYVAQYTGPLSPTQWKFAQRPSSQPVHNFRFLLLAWRSPKGALLMIGADSQHNSLSLHAQSHLNWWITNELLGEKRGRRQHCRNSTIRPLHVMMIDSMAVVAKAGREKNQLAGP